MNATIRLAIVCIWMLGAAATAIGQSPPAKRFISQQSLMQQLRNQHDRLLIDVRTAGEFHMGHVPGAINIPHTALAKRLADIRPHHDKGIILYCESGARAGVAARILREAGLGQYPTSRRGYVGLATSQVAD